MLCTRSQDAAAGAVAFANGADLLTPDLAVARLPCWRLMDLTRGYSVCGGAGAKQTRKTTEGHRGTRVQPCNSSERYSRGPRIMSHKHCTQEHYCVGGWAVCVCVGVCVKRVSVCG